MLFKYLEINRVVAENIIREFQGCRMFSSVVHSASQERLLTALFFGMDTSDLPFNFWFERLYLNLSAAFPSLVSLA